MFFGGIRLLKGAKKIAFSIIELAFAFVALSIALAALAPIISKKMTPVAHSTTSDDSIKTVECFKEGSQYYVSEHCVACDPNERICIECLLSEKDCEQEEDPMVLDIEQCKCVTPEG